jgi:molecular chaperone HtpG
MDLQENQRDKYEEFFESFGKQLKYGLYSDYGMNKDKLKDLLLFYSSSERKPVTLKEYLQRMPEDQKYIYYATGDSVDRIDRLPQTELVKDKGFEILYFTDEVDEFAIKMLHKYGDKEFRSVSGEDLGIEEEEVKGEDKEEGKEIFQEMKAALGDRVKEVRFSKRLKNHPVCFATEGEISIEMEKVLNTMPNAGDVHADKILEINPNHEIFGKLKSAHKDDKEKFELYTELLYDQARLIEGLPIEDPVDFANKIAKLM